MMNADRPAATEASSRATRASGLRNPVQGLLWTLLRLYKWGVSPILAGLFGPAGWGCRFTPTCSDYAAQAVVRHGALAGSVLAVRRLCRCHPWGGCGCDPVPEPRERPNDRAGVRPASPGTAPATSTTLFQTSH